MRQSLSSTLNKLKPSSVSLGRQRAKSAEAGCGLELVHVSVLIELCVVIVRAGLLMEPGASTLVVVR